MKSRTPRAAVAALFPILLLSGCGSRIDTFRPVTEEGKEVAGLFTLVMILSVLVFLLVAVVLILILYRFRERQAGEPSRRSGDRRLEIAWTATPAVLLTVVFVLMLRTMDAVDGGADEAEMTVEVIGHQWWWEYRYPDLGVVTANELHLPVGVPVRLELASDDVIHSFWVPRIGWKMDLMPNDTNVMTVTLDETGVFDGACAEYCGTQHAWMRVRLVAQPQSDFDAWVAAQRQPASVPAGELERLGEDIFFSNTCVNCHTIRGTTADAAVGPDLTHFGSRETIGAGVVENTSEHLAAWVADPASIKPGVLMPGYRLTEEETTALVAYLEGLT